MDHLTQAYCAKCRVMLDMLVTDGVQESWIHPLQRAARNPEVGDHEPEPVLVAHDDPLLDARTMCDFCDAPSPGWTYPCESFTITENFGSADDWAACDDCMTLIQANQYRALARRCAKGRPFMEAVLYPLYQGFARHRSGSPYRHRPAIPSTE